MTIDLNKLQKERKEFTEDEIFYLLSATPFNPLSFDGHIVINEIFSIDDAFSAISHAYTVNYNQFFKEDDKIYIVHLNTERVKRHFIYSMDILGWGLVKADAKILHNEDNKYTISAFKAYNDITERRCHKYFK